MRTNLPEQRPPAIQRMSQGEGEGHSGTTGWKGLMRFLLLLIFFACPLSLLPGCRRPTSEDVKDSLTGEGRLHDMSQIKKGMSPNDVRRIMGNQYKTIYEDGLQGMDMGIYIWEYREGRVYFNTDGAFKVKSYK